MSPENKKLLDHFAGCILMGISANPEIDMSHKEIATYCYDLAEAMMIERIERFNN